MGKLTLIEKLLGYKLSADGYKYKTINKKAKNTLIPAVKAYQLEDLYVGKVVKVLDINEDVEEDEEFDYNLLMGGG